MKPKARKNHCSQTYDKKKFTPVIDWAKRHDYRSVPYLNDE